MPSPLSFHTQTHSIYLRGPWKWKHCDDDDEKNKQKRETPQNQTARKPSSLWQIFCILSPFAFEPPTNQCSNINTFNISSLNGYLLSLPSSKPLLFLSFPPYNSHFTVILFWASDGFLIFLDVFRDVVFYFRSVNASVYMAVEEAWKLLRVLPQPDLERSGTLGWRVKIPQPVCLDPGSLLFQRAGRYKHVRCRHCCLLCLLEHWYLIN